VSLELRVLPTRGTDIEHFDRYGTRIYGSRYSTEDTQTAGVKRDHLSKAGAIIPNSACCDYIQPGRGSGTQDPIGGG
jgi:hypothetical protein